MKLNIGLHSNEDENMFEFRQLCFDNGIEPTLEAIDEFKYALYDVVFSLDVDLKTGKYKIIGVEDI